MSEREDLAIVPHQGVGPVRFGMAREDVQRELGPPRGPEVRGGHCFWEGLFVHFDANGRVEFIELANNARFRALFDGVCLHEVPAEEAIRVVARHGSYDENDPELGYTYVFPELQLSLWRPTRPEPGQAPDDIGGRYFAAVGIGAAGYFKWTR